MSKEFSYTIEEVSQLLKVSKLTVYDLVKKGDLPSFRVGRQMRIDARDLSSFINNQKNNKNLPHIDIDEVPNFSNNEGQPISSIVISGQDMILDILSKHIEKNSPFQALRSYTGSLNSLIAMYNGKMDIVSLHLFDGATGDYNIPFVKKILISDPYIILNLLSRKAGLYVKKGNPLNIHSWSDLKRKDLTFINREKGSGSRILLDEQLKIHNILPEEINGYYKQESNHLSIASAVSTGSADVGIGIEKAAKIVGVDFIPLITERYDLVMLKSPHSEQLIETVKNILSSKTFLNEVQSLGDYDTSQTGKIMDETY